MCDICAQLHGRTFDCGYNLASTPMLTNSGMVASAIGQTYSLEKIADQLTVGYWASRSAPWVKTAPYTISFDREAGEVVTFNLTGLTEDGKKLARWAFEAWHDATGLVFVETASSSAQITLDDKEAGAYGGPDYIAGNRISTSVVNVGTDWIARYGTTIDSYSMQTYVHEIGHAIGLGHSGNYNGTGSYTTDRLFDNDTWQATVMSYFDPTNIGDDYAYAITPMPGDIMATSRLYGSPGNVRAGDTVYGVNGNVGGYLGEILRHVTTGGAKSAGSWNGDKVTFTIVDTGGRNRIDFATDSSNQVIDMRSRAVSDAYGTKGLMSIAHNTVIHDFFAGSGHDRVIGNSLSNIMLGRAGNDTLIGLNGNDRFDGGPGNDRYYGGHGIDIADYHRQSARVVVNLEAGFALGHGRDGFNGIEGAYGSQANDLLIGNSARNWLHGGLGRDRLEGRGGNDRLVGGAASDTLVGGSGDDLLIGAEADILPVHGSIFGSVTPAGARGPGDVLWGSTGNDTLMGSALNDVLVGAADGDRMYGGAGSDEFRFYAASDLAPRADRDLIMDFQTGADRIDMTRLNISSLHYGALRGHRNELTLSNDGHWAYLDVDGDGVADHLLRILGTGAVLTDFVI